MPDLLSGVVSGIVAGLITGVVLMRYSLFIDCKNRVVDALRHAHTHVFVLNKPADYHEKLTDLHTSVGIIQERLFDAGHEQSAKTLGNMITHILVLDNTMPIAANNSLQVADNFIGWLKCVEKLPLSWWALLCPIPIAYWKRLVTFVKRDLPKP